MLPLLLSCIGEAGNASFEARPFHSGGWQRSQRFAWLERLPRRQPTNTERPLFTDGLSRRRAHRPIRDRSMNRRVSRNPLLATVQSPRFPARCLNRRLSSLVNSQAQVSCRRPLRLSRLQPSPRFRLSANHPTRLEHYASLGGHGDNPTVSLLPGIGAVPPAGAWEVSPETTQQYTLTAINSGESSPQTRSIVIVVVPPPPVTIVSFTAEATHLQLGQATTLHWIVLGASQVRIDPGIGPVAATGSAIVRPLGNTIYILTASGPGGTKTGAVPISMAASSSAPATYPNEPQQPARLGPNQMPFSRYGRDSQAMQLLSAVQNAMGGKRNLGAIHGWQRTERVTWEINRGTTVETTTFAAPSDVRIESQGSNTTIDVSNGVAGWTWSSTRPVRSSLPTSTAAGMPFRELPALLLSDDNPQRTVTLAGPSTLLITDKRNDRVFLEVDPSTHLPQAMMWMNLDGSELEENYSNWRQSAGIMWWRHMVRSRNHQEFLRADVTNLQVN